jgi:hypothetical protein
MVSTNTLITSVLIYLVCLGRLNEESALVNFIHVIHQTTIGALHIKQSA